MTALVDWHLDCATCDGEGITYPPAIFGEPVPDRAGEECRDCHGSGHDPECVCQECIA